MRKILFSVLPLGILFSSSALAAPGCVVFSSQAQGMNGTLVPLQVSPGHGLNVNLIPTGEIIKQIWIDDSSRIGASFDGELCEWTSDKQADCGGSGATVIHLRQTELIKIPDLPRSQSGSTLLSAITQGESGRKLYQFSVTPVSTKPTCSSITVMPDPKRLAPLLPPKASQPQQMAPLSDNSPTTTFQRQASNQDFVLTQPHRAADEVSTTTVVGTNSTPQLTAATNPRTTAPTTALAASDSVTGASNFSSKALASANAARNGLQQAQAKKQILVGTLTFKQATTAIQWLERGASTEEAAANSGLPLPTLLQLIESGQ